MKKKYLYICCTNDIYELPLIVEEEAQELARKMGIVKSGVSKRIEHTRNNTLSKNKEKVFKIEV